MSSQDVDMQVTKKFYSTSKTSLRWKTGKETQCLVHFYHWWKWSSMP